MIKILQSNWMCAVLGTICYLVTTVFVWPAPRVGTHHARTTISRGMGAPDASWNFWNPEVDQMIADLQVQKRTLASREQELSDWAGRLEVERQEISTITQTVARLQQDFDQQVVRVRETETTNLKKLAKIYSVMSPDGATTILKELPDEQVVKILMFMKDTETAPILELLAKQGQGEAKRAALITERLRLATAQPLKQS
jgi:flagellar motility protein MotE (MotC chaperone)